MMDWQSGRKYLLSGSPLILVGSSVALLLSSLHILSYRLAFWVICVFILGGITQRLQAATGANCSPWEYLTSLPLDQRIPTNGVFGNLFAEVNSGRRC
jgi:hypothetical protein